MLKIYRHPEYWYSLESITRFIDVEYVNDLNQADYIEIASSENKPVFKDIQKPIIYSYVREHPYLHDEHLVTQFNSLSPTQDITIFSLSSFNKFINHGKNIIVDQFELDAYHRLFVRKECDIAVTNSGITRFLFLGGKAGKMNRKPLYDALISSNLYDNGVCTLFDIEESPDNIQRDSDHYLGYPYDVSLYQKTNFSLIAETHFEHNQEFHPTEKTYRAIANCHPFIVASTPYFLDNLKQRGYKTFGHVIDETYDTMVDHESRLDMIIHSLQTALMKSYVDFESIVQYNKAVLIKNSQNTLKEIYQAL